MIVTMPTLHPIKPVNYQHYHLLTDYCPFLPSNETNRINTTSCAIHQITPLHQTPHTLPHQGKNLPEVITPTSEDGFKPALKVQKGLKVNSVVVCLDLSLWWYLAKGQYWFGFVMDRMWWLCGLMFMWLSCRAKDIIPRVRFKQIRSAFHHKAGESQRHD